MKLKSFKIKSYRSCQNVQFDIKNNLTTLIGLNGAGKSNVLNSILLIKKVFGVHHRYYRSVDEESLSGNCFFEVVLENNDNLVYVKDKIVYKTDDNNQDEVVYVDLQWKFSQYLDNKWVNIPIEYILNDGKSNRLYFLHSLRRQRASVKKMKELSLFFDSQTFKDHLLPLVRKVVKFFDSISYYSASQFSDPTRCPISVEFEDGESSVRYSRLGAHEAFVSELYQTWNANKKDFKIYLNLVGPDGINLVQDIYFKTVEMPSSVYKVQSGAKIKKVEKQKTLAVPIFVIDENILSPNQLSEGTLKTLALIFYILTDKSDILLIEEPEVCIHHGLLEDVLELIKSRSRTKQIIMSTHSDYVLDHIAPESLLLVRYSPKYKTKVFPIYKVMGASNYNILKDYLNNTGNLGEYWREKGFDYE